MFIKKSSRFTYFHDVEAIHAILHGILFTIKTTIPLHHTGGRRFERQTFDLSIELVIRTKCTIRMSSIVRMLRLCI